MKLGVAIFPALSILNVVKTLQTVWTLLFACTILERSLPLQSGQQSTYGSIYFLVTRRLVGAHDNAHLCVESIVFILEMQTTAQLITRQLVCCRQHNYQPLVLHDIIVVLSQGNLSVLSRTNYHRSLRLCMPLYIMHDMPWPVEP